MRYNSRLPHPIEVEHLKLLARLATEERDAFFVRNSGQVGIHKDRFLAAALCQGAALHYLGRGNGVKDFDIHLFYEQHPERRQMSRKVYSILGNLPGFGPRNVDFIRTVVPQDIAERYSRELVPTLRRFLEDRRTANARHLAEKAVVGLVPDAILGTVIWPAIT
jgi:hypothetical protein